MATGAIAVPSVFVRSRAKQMDEHRDSIRTPATCLVDFQVDDTVRSVRALIKRTRVIENSRIGEILIDLSRCRYLGPFGAAILAATFIGHREMGQRIAVNAPLEPKELRAFWHFSGLEALVGGEAVAGADPTDQPTLPLIRFERARFQAADPVIALVHSRQELSEDWEEALRTCVNEIIQNIEDHAASDIGGVLCARFMRSTSSVRVAIVDRGKGICTTLKQRFPDTSSSNALNRVLQGNYSARSRPNNMGVGISNLAHIIENLRGDFCLASESSIAYQQKGGRYRFEQLPEPFAGTGVFFNLPYAQLRRPA